MSSQRSKLALKIVVLTIITMLFLWFIPANLIFAEGEGESPTIEELQAAVDAANVEVANAQTALDGAPGILAAAQEAVDAAQTALDGAPGILAVAQAALDAVIADPDATEQDLTAAQEALDAAQTALDEAPGALTAAQAALQAALDAAENEGIVEGEDPAVDLAEDPAVDPIEDPIIDPLADPLLDPELSMLSTDVSESKCITISIHKYAEWNGEPGQQLPCEPNLSARFRLEWSVWGLLWFNAGEKWTDCVTGDVSFTAAAGLLYRLKEIDRAPGFSYTDTLPRYIPDCNGDRIWCNKNYIVENPVEPKRCVITILKSVDGQMPTEGSFDFTVAVAATPADLKSEGSPVDPIPPTFTLDKNNLYMANYAVECGVEYIITELGPPSGYTFGGVTSMGAVTVLETPGQSIRFTVDCCQEKEAGSLEQPIEVIRLDGSITFNNLKTPGSLLLRLVKTSSATGLPLEGAIYSLYIGSTLIYDLIPTGVDGATLVSLPSLNTVYTVREKTPPPGYALDLTSYTVTAGSDPITITLNVVDSPLTGGGGAVTVAAITESVQVLAFTGIAPIIPISGGSAIAGGLAMLLVSLRKRFRNKK